VNHFEIDDDDIYRNTQVFEELLNSQNQRGEMI